MAENNRKETIYLADTENEGGNRYKDILDGSMDNKYLYIFYTVNSGCLCLKGVENLLKHADRVKMYQCHCGNNGLDFQLISMLGYLIAKNPEKQFIILSNDSGYDPAISFWADQGIMVNRLSKTKDKKNSDEQTIESLADLIKPEKPIEKKQSKSTDDMHMKLLINMICKETQCTENGGKIIAEILSLNKPSAEDPELRKRLTTKDYNRYKSLAKKKKKNLRAQCSK